MRLFRNASSALQAQRRSSAAFASSYRTKGRPMRRSATTSLWESSNYRNPPQQHPPKAKSHIRAKSKPKSTVDALVERFHSLSKAQRYNVITRVARKHTQEIDRALRTADTDRDGLLSHDQLRSLLSSRFRLRAVPSNHAASPLSSRALAPPTRRQLKLVMIGSAIPFVGFGLVDNLILLVAGDAIETHFHASYAMSMLCAAALGNTVADVVGLSLGGIIESMARRIGIPDPMLSKAQANMAVTHWCNFFASAGGITAGCLLGMTPLFFMNHADYEEDEKPTKLSGKEAEQANAPQPVNT